MGLFPTKELTKIAERMETKIEKETNDLEKKLADIVDLLVRIEEHTNRLPAD